MIFSHPSQRQTILGLAVAATSISVAMSVAVAWQRSPFLVDQVLWVGIALITVLGAHLLPAIIAMAKWWTRLGFTSIWLLCLLLVSYSHATFFLYVQADAGNARAAMVALPQALPHVSPAPARSLEAIVADQGKTKIELAKIETCVSCRQSVRIRKAALAARLDELQVQADQVRRWQAAQDRHTTQADRLESRRDAARDDPVLLRLAAWLGMPLAQVTLWSSVVFAAAIEGVACLCWCAWFQGRLVMPVTGPVTTAVIASTVYDENLTATEEEIRSAVPEEPDVVRVRLAIQTGELRPTREGIRQYLRCGAKKAGEIRKIVVAA